MRSKKGRRVIVVSILLTAGLTLFLLSAYGIAAQRIKAIMLPSPDADTLIKMIPKFEEKYGIEVSVEQVAYADIHTKEISDFVAHTGHYDVVMMDNPWTPEFAGAGYIENLEPWIKKVGLRLLKDYRRRWPPGVEEYPTIYLEDSIVPVLNFYGNWKGDLVAIPLMPGAMLFYYRKSLFKDPKEKANFEAKYGYELLVPKTWSQLRDIAEFFTRPDMYGLTLSVGIANMAVQTYYQIAWSMGADCFAFGQGFPDPDDPIHNMPILNSPIGVKALEFLILLKPFMPPGVASYEFVEATQDFIKGKAAMMIQWSVFTPEIEDPAKSEAAGDTGYAWLPGYPDAPINNVPGVIPGEGYSSLGGWALVLNKDSRNKEAAIKFILWATHLTMTEEELTEYLETGFSNSGRKAAYFIPGTKGYRLGRYPIELETYRAHIRRRPAIAEEVEYENIVGSEVQEAYLGRKTPKQALDDAAQRLCELMQTAGYIPMNQPLVWPSKYVNRDGTKVE